MSAAEHIRDNDLRKEHSGQVLMIGARQIEFISLLTTAYCTSTKYAVQ